MMGEGRGRAIFILGRDAADHEQGTPELPPGKLPSLPAKCHSGKSPLLLSPHPIVSAAPREGQSVLLTSTLDPGRPHQLFRTPSQADSEPSALWDSPQLTQAFQVSLASLEIFCMSACPRLSCDRVLLSD